MKFNYVALDKKRKKIRGKVEGESRKEALQELKSQGYSVLQITFVKESKVRAFFIKKRSRSGSVFDKTFGGKKRVKQYESFKEELLIAGFDVAHEIKNIVPDKFDVNKYIAKYKFSTIQVEKIKSGRLNRKEALRDTNVSVKQGGFSLKKRVNIVDLITFTEQLAILLATDVTLVESLETIQTNMKNKKFKAIIDSLVYDLTKGKEFSVALSVHPDVFSPLFIAMVQIGERTGSELPNALEDMVKFLKMSLTVKREFTKAMIYPASILVALVFLLFFVSKFVMPRMNSVFNGNGFVLPKFTLIIFAISENIGIILLCLSVVVIASIVSYAKIPYIHDKVHDVYDNLSLRIPVLSNALLTGYMYQMSMTLAITLKNGLSISEALELVNNIIPNKQLKGDVSEIYYNLEKGRDITDAFGEQERIGTLVKMAVAAGDKSGRLSEGLGRVAEHYEGDFNNKMATLMAIMVPVSIAVIAIVIAPFIIGIYYPIISLTQQIGKMG